MLLHVVTAGTIHRSTDYSKLLHTTTGTVNRRTDKAVAFAVGTVLNLEE
jgi:hypothetical protein